MERRIGMMIVAVALTFGVAAILSMAQHGGA